MKNPSITILSLILACVGEVCFADDDDDLEFDFSNHQKSTIENFPMQAIDQEGLSETAIEGALQVQADVSQNSSNNGKPIYLKQKEENQKTQTDEVLSENKKDFTAADQLLKFSTTLPEQPQLQPIIYQQPTGRTYFNHQTTTIER